MELWALCDPCDRWFFVPFERLEDLSDVACPGCDSPTTSFEARADDLSFSLDMPAADLEVVIPDPIDVTEQRVIWLQ